MELPPIIIILTLCVWLWYSLSKKRELVTSKCARACKNLDIQLLDQSVSLHKVSMQKNTHKRYALSFSYLFYFSINAYDRYPGMITLLDGHIESISFEHPDGRIIINNDNERPLVN